MKPDLIIAPFLVVVLTGCAAQLERHATASAQAQCAAKGKQFIKTESDKSDGLFMSEAQVAGECVGPDDPRYVKAK